jgi:hypothetical protein
MLRLTKITKELRMRNTFALCGALSLSLLTTSGCGSGSNAAGDALTSATRGTASFTINWPEREAASRLIPVAANSIKLTVKTSGGVLLGEQLIVRPSTGGTSAIQFRDLDPGIDVFEATAFASEDATGPALATGSVSMDIVTNVVKPVRITMGSTIASVAVTPDVASIPAGQRITLSATAFNAAGEILLTTANKWTWSGSNASAVLVTPNGNNTAGASYNFTSGTSVIRATETESGKSGTASVSTSVSPFDPDYESYVRIENVRSAVPAIRLDGFPGDWVTIPQYTDAASDAGGDSTRDITTTAIVPTPNDIFVLINTTGAPDRVADTFGLTFDIGRGYNTPEFEVILSPAGNHTLRWWPTEGGAPQSRSVSFPFLIRNCVEARIPISVLKANLPKALGDLLNGRVDVRARVFAKNGSINADEGSMTSSYLIKSTPYILDPPLPQPPSSTRTMTAPVLGKWLVQEGAFGTQFNQGLWSYTLVRNTEAGDTSSPANATANDKYLAWNQSAVMPMAGTVIELVNDQNDHDPSLTDTFNSTKPNYAIIDIGGTQQLLLSCLQKSSVIPKLNDKVKVKDVIGKVGNSGPGFQPHLQFQVQRKVGATIETVPVALTDATIGISSANQDPWARTISVWDIREGYYIAQ